jgi:hypothetical protein
MMGLLLDMEQKSRLSWGGRRPGAGRPRRRKSVSDEFIEKLIFIRDTAGDVARANVANWKGWNSQELQLHDCTPCKQIWTISYRG